MLLGDVTVKLIYANEIEDLVFDIALNDENLFPTFSHIIFEYIFNNLTIEIERKHVFDLVSRLQLNFKYNKNEKSTYEYLGKIINM